MLQSVLQIYFVGLW